MRGAALFAGLTLNAAFVHHAAGGAWRWGDPFTLVAGPLVCGVFLLFGVYWAPARLGLPVRELIGAQFGEWAAKVVYWVWLPLWLVSVYADLAMWFQHAVEQAGLGNAVWGWVLLTVLPGGVRFLVRVGAVVVLGAAVGYRNEWAESVRYMDAARCCEGIWEMQALALWMAPALLLAGERRREGETVLGAGILGIVLPMVVVTTAAFFTVAGGAAVYGPRISKTGNYLSALVTNGQAAPVKWMLVALTLIVAGRFCLETLGERLGAWRRWWLLLPLGWAAVVAAVAVGVGGGAGGKADGVGVWRDAGVCAGRGDERGVLVAADVCF